MTAIARVEVGRFDYELIGEFKFFKASVRPSIVVRLTDENGVQGWGQSVPIETWTYETVESVETTLRHYLAPVILGAEPSDLAGVHARMDRAAAGFGMRHESWPCCGETTCSRSARA